MMSFQPQLACVILLSFLAVAAEAADASFRYSKPLDMPPLTGDELLAVPLDSDVYAATRDDLPDLRIYSTSPTGEKQEFSYLLRRVTTTKSETSREYWQATKPSVKPLPDNALEITVTLPDKAPQPEGLRIISPLEDFEQRVRVFSSSDGENWRPLGDEGVIFDYSQYIDVRNGTLAFPSTTDRHFRIVIDDITQELESQLVDLTRRLQAGVEQYRDQRESILRRPFRIDRIEFWRDVAREQVTGNLKATDPVANFRAENDSELKQTTLSFDSRREPLTAVKLQTKSNNFSRQASVEVDVSTPRERTWRTIGGATISRLAFGNLDRNELTISFPETRATNYRVQIENRASAPLVIDGVEVEGNQYQLVFLASPSAGAADSADNTKPAAYELLYGSDTAEAPDYDTAAITASLADGYQPKSVALGTQTEVAGATVAGTLTLRDLLNDVRVLGVVAAILIAALAWGLFNAGKRLDKLPQDEN